VDHLVGGQLPMIFGAVGEIGRNELEELLRSVLVPVEPSDDFIHRLKGRLIKFYGRKKFTPWTALGGVALILLWLLTAIVFAMRILLVLFTLVGRIEERRKGRTRA
jgi:hypothetical protein